MDFRGIGMEKGERECGEGSGNLAARIHFPPITLISHVPFQPSSSALSESNTDQSA